MEVTRWFRVSGDVGDALDLALFVNHRVHRHRLTVLLADAFGLAEVEAAGQFAHAEDIEAAGDDFLLHRRGVGELGKADRRPEICEEPEMFPQREQRGPLRLLVRRQRLPLWSTHGAEQDGLRLAAHPQRFRRKSVAVHVDGDPAYPGLGEVKLEGEF